MITRHKPWWLSQDMWDDAEMDRRHDEQMEREEELYEEESDET